MRAAFDTKAVAEAQCHGFDGQTQPLLTVLEMIAPANRDLLVIDTSLSGLAATSQARKSRRSEIWNRPRPGGLSLATGGHRHRSTLRLLGSGPKAAFSDWEGAADDRFNKRRVFFCAKERSLADLPVERESSGVGTQFLDTLLLAAYLFRKRVTDGLD